MASSFDKKWNKMLTMILMLVFLNMRQQVVVHGEPQVPCYFIFGDSLVDNGNNNPLLTAAKANYPPYGIDFPDGPTGRFTNGLNTADITAELLGFDKYIPPFASAKGKEILNGVNYGSGAAGILIETGKHLGDVISLDRQLMHHQRTILSLTFLLGGVKKTHEYLQKCLYTVGMGNNDYINNYLMPEYYPSSLLFSPDQFATLLIQQYSLQLKALYTLGARKVAISGLGKLGSIPMYANKDPATIESINKAVQLADDKIKPLVDELNNLPGAQFIYLNSTSISLGDPTPFGISVFDAPCCKVSTTIAAGQCAPGEVPCSNRTVNVFFDNFHPTEIANRLTAARAYQAFLPTDAYPVDISNLVQDSTNNIQQVFGKTKSDLSVGSF
ncbi:lipase [Lithospermum erythrorhizon]|uniref:Lipase n=1 Tax=Lithospermum erythrorhizon TaxID=34254 RepID=A0AAV3QI04_LITER